MRCSSIFAICVLLALGATAQADIIGWNCADGTGGVDSHWNYWQNSQGTATLGISGTHSSTSSGSVVSSFQSDTPGDPVINYLNSVVNDTGLAWSGYNVQVIIDTPLASPLTSYSISGGTVTLPTDWSTTTIPLAYQGVVGGQNEYVGYLGFLSGTPIANNDQLDFKYKVSFAGSTQYLVTQVQTPVLVTIPEPGTLALLAGGLICLWASRRRRAV
jgi:hypothetical protein